MYFMSHGHYFGSQMSRSIDGRIMTSLNIIARCLMLYVMVLSSSTLHEITKHLRRVPFCNVGWDIKRELVRLGANDKE